MNFKALILSEGKTATGVEVPAYIVEGLGTSKRPPVVVRIRDYTYRTSISVMRGRFMLPISAEVRKNAGVAAGETIDIDVSLDTAPREVSMPDDFREALARATKAKEVFDRLAYSHKLRHVLAIEQAKTPETRLRRIQKAINMLEEG